MKNLIILCAVIIHASTLFGQNNNSGLKYGYETYPLVVGHRGGFESDLPENSSGLFDYTISNSCSKPIAIEFDIRESASGSLYLMHDLSVERTTNGTGDITALTDSAINALFLKDRNGIMTSEKIPLFSDLLASFQNTDIILMLDIKGKIWEKVLDLVTLMKMESKCIVLTFNQTHTKLVSRYSDKAMVSALVSSQADWNSLLTLDIPNDQLIVYISKETPLHLLQEINKKRVRIMTDMSETQNNNAQHFTSDFYLNQQSKQLLSIIITDYPIYISSLFCRK